MAPAYISCVAQCLSEHESLDQFEADTGINMRSFARRGAIIEKVDEATGYDRFVLQKFCDWVTEKVWGEEGKEVVEG